MIGLTKKNMPDFYFRGTLAQYWKAIYAEYQRLFLLYGREPFEFTSPNPKTSPLAEYAPNFYDFVEILFWEAEHRDFIVKVKADSVLDSDLVNLYVSIYVDSLKMYGESNLSTWKSVENSLEEQGFLIRPTALLAAKPQKPPKPKSVSDRTAWFIYYEQMNERGFKYTLKQLAADIGISEGHAKRLHGNFLKAI